MVTGDNLARLLPEFDEGGGGNEPPEIFRLTLTGDEAIYLLSIVEGCSFQDDEAISIRNRLRVLTGNEPCRLVS